MSTSGVSYGSILENAQTKTASWSIYYDYGVISATNMKFRTLHIPKAIYSHVAEQSRTFCIRI
jgi:hypothetical protein